MKCNFFRFTFISIQRKRLLVLQETASLYLPRTKNIIIINVIKEIIFSYFHVSICAPSLASLVSSLFKIYFIACIIILFLRCKLCKSTISYSKHSRRPNIQIEERCNVRASKINRNRRYRRSPSSMCLRDLLCKVFGFCTFLPVCLRGSPFISHGCGTGASGPELKPAEERTREKEISRERVPGSIDSVCPRDRPRACACLCAFLCAGACKMRRRLHSCSLLCARIYYNVPRIYAGRPRCSTGPRIYAGNERVIFQCVRAMNGNLVVLVLRTRARLRHAQTLFSFPSLILRMLGAIADP